jgi:1,2-diacylglycerol 3-alpha-glucosyltransferase
MSAEAVNADTHGSDVAHANAPLRVLLVAPQTPPAVGGVETHTAQLATALARRGHRVTLVGSGVAAGWSTTMFGSAGQLEVVTFARPAPSLVGLPPWSWAAQLRTLVADGRFDVAHLHSYHQPYAALTHRVLPAGLARVVTGHYHGTGHSRWANAAHPTYRWLLGRALMDGADTVVCVSAAERRLVERDFAPRRCVVVPNGVELPAAAEPYWLPARTDNRDSQRLVLVVGRLERYKQVARVLDACGHLDASVTVVVAGDGPARAELAAHPAVRAGTALLLGRVDDAVLASLWARADSYVTASREESFGLTLATALALGVPSVASDIPAHREVGVGVAALVSPDASAAQWAETLTAQLAAGRHPAVPALSWPQVAAALETEYRAALERRRNVGRARNVG